MMIFYFSTTELTMVIKDILKDWNREMTIEQQIMLAEAAKQNRFTSLVCSLISFVMETTFSIFQTVTAMQEPDDIEGYALRGLFVFSWFPYDTSNSSVRKLTWFAQWIGAYGGSVIFTSHDCLYSVLSLHISTQYDILSFKMNSIVSKFDDNDPKEFYKRFNEVVERQAELNRYTFTKDTI